MAASLSDSRRGMMIQRYKGLGESMQTSFGKATMDPDKPQHVLSHRSGIRIEADDPVLLV